MVKQKFMVMSRPRWHRRGYKSKWHSDRSKRRRMYTQPLSIIWSNSRSRP